MASRAKLSLTKRATIRRKFFDDWVTLGTINSNWDGNANHKGRTTIWLGAWVGGQIVAFPEEGVAHPYLEGFLCARLIEGKEGEEDYYQRVGFISTKLKPGLDEPDGEVDRYHIRLDCFPITQRQLSLKSQVGLYLSIQEIEKVSLGSAERGDPPDEDPLNDAAMPRAMRACMDFEKAYGLCQEDLELILDLDASKWGDVAFKELRRIYVEISSLPPDERPRHIATLLGDMSGGN